MHGSQFHSSYANGAPRRGEGRSTVENHTIAYWASIFCAPNLQTFGLQALFNPSKECRLLVHIESLLLGEGHVKFTEHAL